MNGSPLVHTDGLRQHIAIMMSIEIQTRERPHQEE
jgi:hypothetical protein